MLNIFAQTLMNATMRPGTTPVPRPATRKPRR